MNNSEVKTRGIFSVKGIKDKNQVTIQHIENIKLKTEEFIQDTFVTSYDIMKDVIGEIHTCNITDVFIMASKTLPLLYINVVLEKPLRRILLYRVYLCFTIESNVTKKEELLDKPLDGKFGIEIAIDGTKQKIDDDLPIYMGENEIQIKLINFTKNDDMKELIKSMIKDVEKKLGERYEKEFGYLKPPTNPISLKNYKID